MLHLSLSKQFPLLCLFWFPLFASLCLISALTQGLRVVTYLGSLVQLCYGEGGTLQTNITGVFGEFSQCLGHTWFAPLMACVLSWSTLLRLQVALHGNCPKQALAFVYFPGLSRSSSSSQILHKGIDLIGPTFWALPRSQQLSQPGAW